MCREKPEMSRIAEIRELGSGTFKSELKDKW